MAKASKNIQVLSEHEHILKRPTIYVGSVKTSDEVVPIIRDRRIYNITKPISVGMYKLFDEVFSNSVDEAKRMSSRMKEIRVSVDSSKNSISVEDTGDGFYNGSEINPKSGLTNVATAVSMLRAGSNFENDSIEESLIGTNGMGVSLVNALSSDFSIRTSNKKETYFQKWNNFLPGEPVIKAKTKGSGTGTLVSFTPLSSVFDGCSWDLDIIRSTLIFKKRVLESEEKTKDLKIILDWDGKEEQIKSDVYSEESYKTSIGELLIWETYENSFSPSFVNSAICTGVHQKIIYDEVNGYLDDSLGHHFYDFLLILNLPPALVKFGDQNKTKFVTKRDEIDSLISGHFSPKIKSFTKTKLFSRILKKVEDRKRSSELKTIRRERKKINVKYSHKYFPPTMSKAKNLFIVEGLSAMGSILQKRNTKTDGVYALKGKIKNARSLGDLSSNREILELMQILNLDPESPSADMPYENIVIATDQDPDGAHITSLLINLFYSWFPWIVKRRKLYFLETPLVSTGDRVKNYYYSLESFKKSGSGSKSNVRYLKGLGSLSLEDWDFVMKNKRLINITEDKSSPRLLEMAFGKSSEPRKAWLSGF